MKKTVVQNSGARILGVFPVVIASGFIYAVRTNFSDDFFAGMRPMFYMIASTMIAFGIFMLFSRIELIYDETSVEKKTTFLGLSWSKKVDRSLVKDIGPEAAGLIQRYPRHSHVHHDHLN